MKLVVFKQNQYVVGTKVANRENSTELQMDCVHWKTALKNGAPAKGACLQKQCSRSRGVYA